MTLIAPLESDLSGLIGIRSIEGTATDGEALFQITFATDLDAEAMSGMLRNTLADFELPEGAGTPTILLLEDEAADSGDQEG